MTDRKQIPGLPQLDKFNPGDQLIVREQSSGSDKRFPAGSSVNYSFEDLVNAINNSAFYGDSAAGIAGTSDGEYFITPSPVAEEYAILYLNDSNTAVEQSRYPSSQAIATARADADTALQRSLLQPLMARSLAINPPISTETLRSDFANRAYGLGSAATGLIDELVPFSGMWDFTRPSPKWVLNAVGDLVQVPAGEIAYSYDPATGKPLGAPIEEARTNLLLWSDDFTNAAWSKDGTTITANAIKSPDGTITTDKIVADTSTGFHRVIQSVTTSATHTVTAYVTPAELDTIVVESTGLAGSSTRFNLGTGAITPGASADAATVKDLGNGLYRVRVTWTYTGSTNVRFYLVDGAGNASFTGDGSSGLYIWRAVVEAGSFPTSPIKTEGSQVTRLADDCSRTLGAEYNPDEGTLICAFWDNGSNETATLAALSDSNSNTFTNAISRDDTGQVSFSGDLMLELDTILPDQLNIIAMSYSGASSGTGMASMNGADAISGQYTGRISDAMDRINIGKYAATPFYANTEIAMVRYIPKALTAAQLKLESTLLGS